MTGDGTVVFGNGVDNSVYPVNANSALTLGPGITVRGLDGNLGLGYGPITNLGTISADVSGGIIYVEGLPFNNAADLQALAGTVNVQGNLNLNGNAIISGQAAGTIQITGDLVGNTRNVDQFNPQGTTEFTAGTHSLEAMSQDIGNVPTGYVKNFAYGTILLDSGAQVTLVDQFTNSSGTSPECIYANSLIVPAGASLNLNGLHVYTRLSQIVGSLSFGSVSQAPTNAGPLTLNTGVPGSLSAPGVLDEWTFFGRAGEHVAVVVELNSTDVLSPQLAYADVRLLDPQTNLLAETSNNVPQQAVALLNQVLPMDGTYAVQVRAPDNESASTGDYKITVWDATPAVQSLLVNQPVNGRINTPFSVNEWDFSAVAGQQVQFNLVNVSSPGVAFNLTGPGNWVGFSNLVASSDLVTLPYSGAYALTAYGTGGQYGNAYAFDLVQTAETNLNPGSMFTGTFLGNGQAELIAISLTNSGPLRITLNNTSTNNVAELYAQLGSPPTRGTFSYESVNPNSSSQQILIPNAVPGTYYVLVYGNLISTPGDYTLQAMSGSFFLSGIAPNVGNINSTVTLTLSGAGFVSPFGVQLVASDGTVFPATTAEADSFTQITATFAANTVPLGTYSVLLSQGSSGSAEVTNAFTVTSGQAFLTTTLEVPATLSEDGPATFFIDYTNSGTVPMPAPLIQLSSTDPLASPILTLQPQNILYSLVTSNLPPGCATSATILASGAQPGVLNPGEQGRVPVYYLGDLVPWPSGPILSVGLSVIQADDSRPMNWNGQTYVFAQINYIGDSGPGGGGGAGPPFMVDIPWQNRVAPTDGEIYQYLQTIYGVDSPSSSLSVLGVYNEPGVLQDQPPSISTNAWTAIVSNLEQTVGSTLGAWVQSLDNQAAYLGRQGLIIADAANLWSFEVLQAVGLGPLPVLDREVDASVPTPGLGLSLSRSFLNSIPGRYHSGMFGYGWAASWNARLSVGSNGVVSIDLGTGSPLIYNPSPQLLRGYYLTYSSSPPTAGTYISAPGDTSTLIGLYTGEFDLQNANGVVTRFSTNGLIEYVQDPNSNRIAVLYNTANQILSLTHSSGQFLNFTYNAAAVVTSVSDSAGRTTQYAYDAANQHLLQVTSYDARVTSYAYSIGNGVTAENALTSVTFPDLTHRYFTYDNYGRLASTFQDAGAQQVTFGYDEAGTVSITDASNAVSQEFFDYKGQIVKIKDPLGNITTATYDTAFNLTRLTDPVGGSTTFNYDGAANLTAFTDALRHTTQFAYRALNRLTDIADAKGDTTIYSYTPNGNPETSTYANDTQDHTTYDPIGNPRAFVNRRGQTTTYAYNSAGQLTNLAFFDGTTIAYTYNAAGDLLTAGDGSGTISFTYDAGDRLTKVAYPNKQYLSYTYDTTGRRTTMTDQSGLQTKYVYNGLGQLSKLLDASNNVIVIYTYDNVGRLSQKGKANGTYTTYAYDPAGHLVDLLNYAAGGAINSRFDSTYNSLGQRTAMTTVDGVWSYNYDALGELTYAAFNSTNPSIPNQYLAYVYDAMGNRLQTIINGVTTFYVANNMNEYTELGGTNYTYDMDGNLSYDGINSYAYDSLNRLVSISGPSNSWVYEYDALGNRDAVVANGQRTEYLYDPTGLGHVAAEYNNAGHLQAHYTYGLNLASKTDGNGNSYLYDFDAVGGTAGVSGTNGIYLDQYEYMPFGETLSSAEAEFNPFRFSGQFGVMSDTSNVECMRARYYSTGLGRFMTQDPLGIIGADFNLRRYCYNSPVNFADPSGLDIESWANAHVGLAFTLAIGVPITAGLVFGAVVTAEVWVPALLADEAFIAGSAFYGTHMQSVNSTAGFVIDKSINGTAGNWADLLYNINNFADSLAQFRWTHPIPNLVPGLPVVPPPNAQTVPIVRSQDPNRLIGPGGYAAQNYLVEGNVFAYEIVFENETNATAPAQVVQVSDLLSPNLDWATFQLTEIAFGRNFIAIPPNVQHFQTNLPMSYNGVNFQVQIEAGINLASGQVFGNFYSIDPVTSLPPPVDVGFLPPEDGSGRGIGHISYLVRPNANLATGLQISNVAYIQFDGNPVIATDQVNDSDPSQGVDTNKMAIVTIDNSSPFSAVINLPYVTTNGNFTVCWSGTNAGPAIVAYDIYVATNSGPWNLWLAGTTNTCAVFQGQMGNVYGFYSVAHDGAGIVQQTQASANTTTIVAAHLPPQISPLPNQFIAVGQELVITNQAQDPDQPITFALGAGAPAGASITTDGIFMWTPACSQASTTNVITIWATDSYSIPLSNSVSFVVAVGECLQLGIGSTVMQVGQTSSVPVNLVSTLGLTNLSFVLAYPPNRFTNLVMVSSNSAIGTATVETVDASQTLIGIVPGNGQTLQGPSLLGSIQFQALPGHSAFVPLTPNNLVGTMTDGSAVGNASGQPGRAVVIGPEPLVEAWLGTNSQRMLTLYGNPGATYALGFRTNVLGTNWQFAWSTPMTNLYEVFGVDPTPPLVFYRAWEFFSDPPMLELKQPSGSKPSLLLYGQAGTNRVVQATTDLSVDGAGFQGGSRPSLLLYGLAGSNYIVEAATNLPVAGAWFPATNFTLTNSFRFIDISTPTNKAMFFRAKRP